ncbi:NAD(P)-dependent dehydrogenase, short-chain alcohol dehydrogenase family [Lentibacillus halodurans]|uniref:NAD(P)-dependent dehydrogenase, short-chain alcohol dehydrogenase family n=1 Tax=Lentibacillus halodurans TaxID=237679 RepID=A0A1I0Z8N3_9BACI|nr:short chain dehydrogenase [Lentibacillus halodurans]SFB21476.1 NAD(P)-dependent dehydrogenase, short-chain alcohol dehydrogenase family [Lentibacillus halodurans]
MRILLVGASGTIGQKITEALASEHVVLRAGRNGADVSVDITSPESIASMYEEIGRVDAVINASGGANFKTVPELTPELNEKGIESKLKGQINLVLLGQEYVNDGGSFTLTTGVMMDDPIPMGASAAMANGGVKAFVKAASIEIPRGIRINSVSPNIVEESWSRLGGFFAGFDPVPAARVARAYVKSVEGAQTGQNYKVY